MTVLANLPISPFLPAITDALAARGVAIVKAEPGAGKTTQLPKALLTRLTGKIIVLEPRRLAARLSAERIATELGEPCGETVGYQIRFASRQSARTKLLFVTEGVFLRLLQDNPGLAGVDAVVIDEFHERHLHTDLALAAVTALRNSSRPELALVVMSATLDTAALESYLVGAAVFDIPGRTYPVAVEYKPCPDGASLEDHVALMARAMLGDQRVIGDILVFLPGMQDIKRCAERLKQTLAASGALILPLAADLSATEQAQVFAASQRRKVILSTNVAETSLTIPGVTAVIDSGLAKIAGHASWSGISTLDVKKISQAACIQRSGRAGRTAPGVAYRLFSEGDYLGRPPFSVPDIRRLDLAEVFLTVQDLGRRVARRDRFDLAMPWFEAPAQPAVEAARQLLLQLGAIDDNDLVTPLGERMAELPFHPRLAAMVVKGQELKCAREALAAATLIGEGMLLRRGASPGVHSDCDVRLQLGLVARLSAGIKVSPQSLAQAVDPGSVKHLLAAYQQVSKRFGVGDWPAPGVEDDERIVQCLLAGFPDRVAKRRQVAQSGAKKQPLLYNFCLGRGGFLAESSTVRDAEFLLALDAAEATSRSGDRGVAIYAASAVAAGILQQVTNRFVTAGRQAIWVSEAERADLVSQVRYGELVVSEARVTDSGEQARLLEELLLRKFVERWPKPFDDDGDLISYHARRDWLIAAGGGEQLPLFTGEMLELLQADICGGKRSFREIKERPLAAYIEDQLAYDQLEELQRNCPIELRLANGRRLKVHYESERPPFVSGFIQDFYGLTHTPVLAGRPGLTIHLLAPSRRPLQVTADLGGFWQRHYPGVRAELSRKYPKHYWPEEPATAEPFLYYNQMLTGRRPDSKS